MSIIIAPNGLQIYPVRLSELPLSIPTNGYIEDNCFLRRRQKSPEGAACPGARRATSSAALGKCAVTSSMLHKDGQ